MNKAFLLVIVIVGVFILPNTTSAQEEPKLDIEQSAEVFLDDYSDEFQENFFEGLKQKGIQNYDRAIAKFLECQRLEPENEVLHYELAKAYLLDKKFILAQESAIKAVIAAPANYWYANTLVNIIDANKSVLDQVKNDIPWKNETLRKNIAEVYFKKKKYNTAEFVLKGLPNQKMYAELQQAIAEAINKQKQSQKTNSFTVVNDNNSDVNNASQYKSRLDFLIKANTAPQMILQVAEEALENYPSQPYFYFANGFALNRTNKNRKAISILEAGLDYLVNDIPLQNKIYKELADAYLAISNPAKADMYTRKIIPGF